MALRSKAQVAAGIVLAAAMALAQPHEYTVRHDHLFGGGTGTLRFDADAVTFTEGKKHSRTWRYEDVQQLKLTRDSVRVLSYEDAKWKGGRDREWTFRRLPEGAAEKLYAFLNERLDQRFVAAIPNPGFQPLWEVPVKLRSGFGGPEGVLAVGADSIVFDTEERGESRSWRLSDVDNVASADPFSLTITTLERSGLLRSAPTEFHFQLKRPLSDERYQALWRQVNRSKGLAILNTHTGDHP